MFSIFSLNTAAVFYLFSPTLVGIYVAITALIVAFIQYMVSISLALKGLEGVKEAYEIGRVAKGLSVWRCIRHLYGISVFLVKKI